MTVRGCYLKNPKANALNYSSSETNQSITTVDSSGNLSYLSFPTGIIVVWYPTDSTMTSLALVSTTVPKGWAICDGTKGTPDLRGRFVLMAQDSPNSSPRSTVHAISQKGGEEAYDFWNDTHGMGYSGGNNNMRWNIEKHSSDKMPPFYTLVYIMRL